MAKEVYFADVLKEIYENKKSGSLFINVVESSEDLIRLYFRNGEIYYISYGSAIGDDAMEIIEFYTLGNTTFFQGLAAPDGVVASKFPTKKFIEKMNKTYKKVRVP